jgi:hypothetical protein
MTVVIRFSSQISEIKFCNEVNQLRDRIYQLNHCAGKVVIATFRRKLMTISTPTIPDEINESRGHTVDTEGLLNNYAIEPEMYEEDGNSLSKMTERVTVVDIFDSEEEAQRAVLEMEQKGLRSTNISIVAKDYKGSGNMLTWKTITEEGGLAVVLNKLGISDFSVSQFVEACENGKFLAIEIGGDREASQVQHVLEKAGHSLQES